MHDYVQALIGFVLAVAAALIWTALDRKRKDYAGLAGWFRVYLRYVLAVVMLSYGFSKVFDLQFSPPGASRLTESYGDSSPMGLAWTFMGYSIAYTVFSGAMECLGGLLLFFRRTATLGALVTAAVMTNIVMMNFCYDIPVKLYSAHLLMTAVVILGPAMARLMDVLVLHRGVAPEDVRPPSWSGWRRWGRWSLKALVVGFFLCTNISGNWFYRKRMAASGGSGAACEAEAVTRNGAEVPPLVTDKTRWRYAILYGNFLVVRAMDGSRANFTLNKDEKAGTWTIAERGPDHSTKPAITFHASAPDDAHILLEGLLDGAQTQIRLVRKEAKDFPLMNRGFHWINEMPYNR